MWALVSAMEPKYAEVFHKELLDCHLAVKLYLQGKICYAKAALAKHFYNAVVTSFKFCSVCKLHSVFYLVAKIRH